jgi:predicted naringenin-chalcone synthase
MASNGMARVSSISSELNDFNELEGKKIYNVSKSRLVSLINWVLVFRLYLPILWYIVVGILLAQVGKALIDIKFDFRAFYVQEMALIQSMLPLEAQPTVLTSLGWQTMLIIALLIWYINHREQPVYLIDFSTFQPPDSWRISQEQLVEILRKQNCFSEESILFQERMLKQSGCGPRTAWPPGIVKCLNGEVADRSVEGSRKESETVMFDCVRGVLEKTGTNPKDIDILVVNCSLFAPTPSLCTMIINEFGMRSDICSYNLSGMGCSAGLISVELVKNLLASRPHSRALIMSTEIITPNLYHGDEKSFLLQNTLFRCGGAAILLSNKWSDAYRASFKLLHVVRTQYVNEDSFGCVYQTEDSQNHLGVRLSKDIVKIAGRAMERNLTTLGPYILPISEQAKTAFWMITRFLTKKASSLGIKFSRIDPYIPDFKRGIDHFCIHAGNDSLIISMVSATMLTSFNRVGGRGVIDGIEKNLNLTPRHVEASRYALYT